MKCVNCVGMIVQFVEILDVELTINDPPCKALMKSSYVDLLQQNSFNFTCQILNIVTVGGNVN